MTGLKINVVVRLLGMTIAIMGMIALVNGAGECGNTSGEQEAMKLAPCAMAAQDEKSAVSSGCCAQIQKIGHINPDCLCAVMLSNTAKRSGINPAIAMTIPKRCNIADRPVGYKCGPYTLP